MDYSASRGVYRASAPDLPARCCVAQLESEECHASLFPEAALDSTRFVVLSGERVNNPPFYGQLVQMGFSPADLPDFAHMAAITFVDTVVSHEAFTDRLLFHELVHVLQYARLGLAEFVVKYVRGFLNGGSYEAIPLEINAYELDARFAAEPATAFSVEAEVQSWIAGGKY